MPLSLENFTKMTNSPEAVDAVFEGARREHRPRPLAYDGLVTIVSVHNARVTVSLSLGPQFALTLQAKLEACWQEAPAAGRRRLDAPAGAFKTNNHGDQFRQVKQALAPARIYVREPEEAQDGAVFVIVPSEQPR